MLFLLLLDSDIAWLRFVVMKLGLVMMELKDLETHLNWIKDFNGSPIRMLFGACSWDNNIFFSIFTNLNIIDHRVGFLNSHLGFDLCERRYKKLRKSTVCWCLYIDTHGIEYHQATWPSGGIWFICVKCYVKF